MAFFERTKITDEAGNAINPARDESIILLRRITKLLESLATVDSSQRQRVAVDAALPVGTNSIGNIGTVTTLTGITNALPAGTNVLGGITTINGFNQQMFSDPARTAYNTGIRSKLTFS